jgi:hypothetical protein
MDVSDVGGLLSWRWFMRETCNQKAILVTQDELLQLVITHLDRGDAAEPWSEQHGAVLYSDLASIRSGPFYLLGINPGGQAHEGAPIRKRLHAPRGTNSYADECWTCSSSPCEHIDPETGHLRPEARISMQKRVCDLIGALGVAPRDLPSVNLAFARSPELAKLPKAREWFRRCWPIHQALLREVRPAWIVMLGYGAAYYFLSARGTPTEAEKPIEPGSRAAWHQRMNLDIGEGVTLDVRILAVAHPGHRGFRRAGLGGAECYPDELKEFIANHVRPGAAEGGP